MTPDHIGGDIERLFEAGAPRLTLDDLTGVEVSRAASGSPAVLPWAAGLVVVLALGAVLVSLTGPRPGPAGPGEGCLTPPVEELTRVSDVSMTLEPNPVVAGAEATLTVDAEVGVPARWQCWDGNDWVDTHYLFRAWAGASYVIRIQPGSTVTWPAVGFSPLEQLTVTIPDVGPGFYRIEDGVAERGFQGSVFTIVEVVVAGPTIPSTTTTLATSTTTHVEPTTTTTLPPDAENVPFDTGPLAPRGGHSVVWTGTEMIVWGGAGSERPGDWFADGAAFNPVTDTWRMIAESPLIPRTEHLAEWTGSEMLIVGGLFRREAAAYDPATDTWRDLPELPFQLDVDPVTEVMSSVWTGEEMIVWHVPTDQVAAYSPSTDTWRTLLPVGMVADRGVLRWSGEETYALGALIVGRIGTELSAARLDGSDWVSLPTLEHRYHRPMLSAWSGDRLIVWAEDGLAAAWAPGPESWLPVEPAPVAGFCEGLGKPLEIGDRILAFEWCGEDLIYEPASGEWSQVTLDGFGDARYAVWTGTEVLLWGDTCCYGTAGVSFTVRAWRWTPPD